MRTPFILFASLFFAGNAVPRDAGVLALQAQDMRVASVGHRIATANVAQCPVKAPQTGLVLHSLGQYGGSSRTIMAAQFGVSAFPTIWGVVPGSAAARAGLYEGDVITAVNGVPLPNGITRKPSFKTIEAAENSIEIALRKGPAVLSLARTKGVNTVRLLPQAACPSFFQIVPGKKLNATAAGRYVQLTSAIVDAAQGDDELAFIIAHEMAHNILDHKTRLKAQGRATKNIRSTEVEADQFGLTLMHSAGYDPRAAARFWARVGDRMDAGFLRDGTHLSPGKRIVLLQSIANSLPR
jgi:beta-barrel assembly-enhancing protease